MAKHLNLDAVEIIPPSKAALVLRDKPKSMLPVPGRFVRTNHATKSGDLQARSRLVLPGHLLSK
eukprot:12921908-Prorocentrum_lima.AAC.1